MKGGDSLLLALRLWGFADLSRILPSDFGLRQQSGQLHFQLPQARLTVTHTCPSRGGGVVGGACLLPVAMESRVNAWSGNYRRHLLQVETGTDGMGWGLEVVS